MTQLQEFSASGRLPAVDPSAFFCKDCKSKVDVESLIDVDPLHKQCPHCLFVFFFDAVSRSR